MPGVPWVFSFCMKDMLHDTDMFMLHDIGRATGHQPGKMTEYKPGGWPQRSELTSGPPLLQRTHHDDSRGQGGRRSTVIGMIGLDDNNHVWAGL